MPRLRSQAFPWLLAAAAVLAPAVPARAQVVVVTARSVEGLLADVRYLAPLVGQDERIKQLDAFLKAATGDKGLDGVDGKRPFGFYVNWPDKVTDLNSLSLPTVGFLPVTDEAKFVGLLTKLQCQPKKTGDGLYQLTAPVAGELFLRFAHGHVYAADQAGLLGGPLPEPATLLPADAAKHTLSARCPVERWPAKEYTKFIDLTLDPFTEGLNQAFGNDEKNPSETDAQYRQRQASRRAAKMLPSAFKTGLAALVEQIREITFYLDVDPRLQRVTLDLALVPRPGSGIATFCEYAGGARSQFSYLGKHAGLSALLHFPRGQSLQGTAEVPKHVPEGLRGVVDARYHDALVKLLEVLFQTLATDGFDGCLIAREVKPGADVYLVGLKLQNGRKLDHLLRDTFKNLPATVKSDYAVQWNHAEHAGARIHKLKVKEDEAEILLALRDDVAYLAFGNSGLPVVKEALDGLGKTPAPATALLQVEVTGAGLVGAEAFEKSLSRFPPGTQREKLQASVTLRGGADLRLRVEVDAQLLRLLPGALED